MQHLIRITATARPVAEFLRKWGPYLLPAIVLPGGIIVAVLMLVRQRRMQRAASHAAPAPATAPIRGTPARTRSIAMPAGDSRAVPGGTLARTGRFARQRMRALATIPFH